VMHVMWWIPSSFMEPLPLGSLRSIPALGSATSMPTEQYHEPPDELSGETRTFARMIASLQEESED